jgi:4-alpha-glucanotransferase
MVRIDHFRGFDAYYSIPASAETAKEGRWEKGIGEEMFRVAEEVLGKRPIIAEDLGFETDSLRALLARCGYPGMRILQHGFGAEDYSSRDLPHHYPANCIAYTGTHDNATLAQWLDSLHEAEKERIRAYLWRFDGGEDILCESLIVRLLQSPAALCVIPLQDYLGLGAEGRMNVPSRGEGNWQWRVRKEDLNDVLWGKISRMTLIGGRRKTQM